MQIAEKYLLLTLIFFEVRDDPFHDALEGGDGIGISANGTENADAAVSAGVRLTPSLHAQLLLIRQYHDAKTLTVSIDGR